MSARIVAVAVVLLAAGCPDTMPAPGGGTGYTADGCKIGCDKCGPEALCVGLPYVPVCLQQCVTTADCSTGVCTLVAPMGPQVCVTPKSTTACEAVDCQIAPRCRDAKVLLRPLPASSTICGWELVPCDNGCDAATGSCN